MLTAIQMPKQKQKSLQKKYITIRILFLEFLLLSMGAGRTKTVKK